MDKIITQKVKYKQSVIKFNEWQKTIYRWIERHDGSLESLVDHSRRPHYHLNQHTAEEIKLIKNYKVNNKDTGLVVVWVKLRRAGYTRTIQGLYHCMIRLGIYNKTPSKKERKKWRILLTTNVSR